MKARVPGLRAGLCAVLALVACSNVERTWYEISFSGVPIGYMEFWSEPGDSAAGDPVIEHGRIVQRITLLGQKMNTEISGTRAIDPRSGETAYYDLNVRTGSVFAGSHTVIDGDTVRHTTKPGGETRAFALDPDVFTGDSFDCSYLAHLMPGDEPVTRRALEFLRGTIHTTTYTPVAAETLIVGGTAYDCLVLDVFTATAGISSRIWVERGTGRFIRQLSPDASSITLADRTVRSRVQRGDLDDLILAEVATEIEDVRAITAMRVRARVRAAGEPVSAASLNRSGQSFDGSVERNLIDGVFEVRHDTYDGINAPPFPPPVDETLEKYLEPEMAIESKHPDIRAKALELTDGATDSWDAVNRISLFVATEIGGAIPGGGTAIGTLREGKAECGGHSRLVAALCRSVGIPARCVMGCMYVSDGKRNFFGQHMWNEVHMGEAGWIPIDATAREVDYVDSGHIRLGMLTTFNPIEMEILDYEVGPPVPDPLQEDGRVEN